MDITCIAVLSFNNHSGSFFKRPPYTDGLLCVIRFTLLKRCTFMNSKVYPRMYFLIALVYTLFLFYIDEGYNDFRWMKDPGNWIIFVLYLSIITGTLMLFDSILFKRLNSFLLRTFLTTICGMVGGVMLLVGLLYALRNFK